MVAGCASATGDGRTCTNTTVSLAAGAPPVFDWPTSCAVAGLHVTAANNRGDIKWNIATTDQQPTLAAPVTYGEAPQGVNEAAPAAPLDAGIQYRLNLLASTSSGFATTVASVLFTQP